MDPPDRLPMNEEFHGIETETSTPPATTVRCEVVSNKHMGSCQNQGPFLDTLNNRCRIIIGTPKRGHNFENHSYIGLYGVLLVPQTASLSLHASCRRKFRCQETGVERATIEPVAYGVYGLGFGFRVYRFNRGCRFYVLEFSV